MVQVIKGVAGQGWVALQNGGGGRGEVCWVLVCGKAAVIIPATSRLPKFQFIYELTGPSSLPLLESDWEW